MPATDIYERLTRLEIELPKPRAPIANFHNFVRAGDLIFLSGQGPVRPDGSTCTGRVTEDISVDEARAHARLVGVNLLAVMQEATGDLNRITRIVKLLGFVNAPADFQEHPRIIDGCSELMMEVFGHLGGHARSAVGMASLPQGITVEIEGVVTARP